MLLANVWTIMMKGLLNISSVFDGKFQSGESFDFRLKQLLLTVLMPLLTIHSTPVKELSG